LAYGGYEYYKVPLEERFYTDSHDWFKPSGVFGHGLGIIGTLMILIGVMIYIARKRFGFLQRYIRLKYLLEFHIFLCTLGPILILFHTAFKFGGIVSVAFWSMVAVVLSGVIGRFLYIQIPRSIEGKALTLNEVQLSRSDIANEILNDPRVSDASLKLIRELISEDAKKGGTALTSKVLKNKGKRAIRKALKNDGFQKEEMTGVINKINQEMVLTRRMKRLERIQNLFKYWHVAHLPFALIMLIIVVIHVGVTLAFGYKWIF
jgi:hypothetical protein